MKKLIYLLSITFLMLQSCSSGNEPVDSGDNNNPNGEVLLKRITNINGDVGLLFNYIEGNKLSTITTKSGEIINKITYTGDQITYIEWPSDQIDVFTYDGDKIIQFKEYSIGANNSNKLEVSSDYIYNSDGSITINSLTNNGTQNWDKSKYILHFDASGNLIKRERFYFGNYSYSNTTYYEYDTNNSPYKNIRGNKEALSHLFRDPYKNNLVKETSISASSVATIEYTAKYKYNSIGYPISFEYVDNGNTSFLSYYY